MNMRQKIAVVIIDVLILIELCVGMYFAVGDPDNFQSVFFKVFLGTFIPTIALGIFIVKKLKSSEPEEVQEKVES